jgi:hypothetical protein
MEKDRKIILTISIVCAVIIISFALPYFLVKPRYTCCMDFFFTSYSHPNNSTKHFSFKIFSTGAFKATMANLSAFRFTNASDTYYPIKAFANGTEISFPLIIQQEMEVNITLELDWHFTIGSQYTFTLEYDYGKVIAITFTANKVTYSGKEI